MILKLRLGLAHLGMSINREGKSSEGWDDEDDPRKDLGESG